jgi:predicted nuclease with TOPRIM domain
MQLAAVKQDKNLLQQERQQLKSKVQELNESVSRLSREKIDLERSLELEEEAFINSLFRQVANVMDNYKAMDEASPCPHVC